MAFTESSYYCKKGTFFPAILFSFFKWGTLAQKKGHFFPFKKSEGAHTPIAPSPRFRGPCFLRINHTIVSIIVYLMFVTTMITIENTIAFGSTEISSLFASEKDWKCLRSWISWSWFIFLRFR